MSVMDDAQKFGQTVGAARGTLGHPNNKKKHFAKLIGTSVPTLTRLEEGKIGTVGDVHRRREWAERIIEKTGCPPEWFGLSELEPGEADRLRGEMEQKLVEVKNEVRAELATELEALRAQLSSRGIDVPKEK